MLPPQSWHAASTLISYRELPVITLQQNHGRSSLSFLLEDSDWSSFTPVHWKQCIWELFQADLPGFCNLCGSQVVICSSSPTRASLHRSFVENQANPSLDKLPQPARERCHPTLAGNGCLFILARSLLILLSRFKVSWKNYFLCLFFLAHQRRVCVRTSHRINELLFQSRYFFRWVKKLSWRLVRFWK